MNCPFCNSKSIIKQGRRKSKQRNTQKYQCKSCNRYFTLQLPQQLSKTYSLMAILNTISSYNLGTPLRKIANQNMKVPSSTIYDWIKNINLPMNRLRSRLKHIPKHNIIIKQRFLHHRQPFLYQYHSIKLGFAKKYPYLVKYLTTISSSLPKDIFKNSKRISQEAKESKNQDVKLTTKQNYAVQLAKLAASITNDNKKRYSIIENFMLINDTATIAVEVPVFLKENNKILTGHIDILQIRYNQIHILDYKPEPVNKLQTINQLLLYKKALSSLTGINHFRLAFFNEKGYYGIC